jgi:hypothetical protein
MIADDVIGKQRGGNGSRHPGLPSTAGGADQGGKNLTSRRGTTGLRDGIKVCAELRHHITIVGPLWREPMITVRQIKGARGILDWTQDQLAARMSTCLLRAGHGPGV